MPDDCLVPHDGYDQRRHFRSWLLPFGTLLALSLVLTLLQGCVALVGAGVGAAVGATVMVRDRRGQDAVIDDKEIEFKSREWPGSGSQCQVAVNSYNRVVLLTGQCADEAAARNFAERVSRVPKVSRVVDEITLGPFADLSRQSEDTLITSRAKLALVGVDIKGFDPTRVTVVTESGIVYLLGLVTAEEAEATVQQVRYVPGVVRVVKVFEITQYPTTAVEQGSTPAIVPPLTGPAPPQEAGGSFDDVL
jgi:osmotically-inducible protein OsmY